jgi:hypothetical protein
MKTIQIISKVGCHRCEDLKTWLNENKISFVEWKLEDPLITKRLLDDPKFVQKFCDIDGCMVYTPVLRIEETGDYYFKELFNQMGLRLSFLKKILDIV